HRLQKQVGGFPTKRVAQASLNDALAALQRGGYIAPSRQTVGEFLAVWIEGAQTELAVTAWKNYAMVIDNYITPHLGSKRLVDLSPMRIKPWQALLLDHGAKSGKPLSTRSVQLAH